MGRAVTEGPRVGVGSVRAPRSHSVSSLLSVGTMDDADRIDALQVIMKETDRSLLEFSDEMEEALDRRFKGDETDKKHEAKVTVRPVQPQTKTTIGTEMKEPLIPVRSPTLSPRTEDRQTSGGFYPPLIPKSTR